MRRIAIVLALLSAPAAAQVRELGQYGDWRAFVAQTTRSGLVCGINARGPLGQAFYVKWFQGNSDITFHVSKPTWNLPPGVRVPVTLQIDGGTEWEATATRASENMIEWQVSGDAALRWITQFRAGSRLVLRFPAGSEVPWSVSLWGSSLAMVRLGSCIGAVGGSPGGGPSQPYGGPGPSQPYGARPAPSQPYGSPPPAQPAGPPARAL